MFFRTNCISNRTVIGNNILSYSLVRFDKGTNDIATKFSLPNGIIESAEDMLNSDEFIIFSTVWSQFEQM